MMVPVGRLVLMRAVPKRKYVAALNYLTIPALLGPVIGPALGGAITLYFHWRWIFLINVPISILGLFLVLRHIPNVRETGHAAVRPARLRAVWRRAVRAHARVLGARRPPAAR